MTAHDPSVPRTGVAVWLTGPVCLLAALAAAYFVLQGPGDLFGYVIGGLIVLALGWALISAFLPAKPDKQCPACGAESVGRLDPHTTRGLVCAECGWQDAEASSFYLAEEEGPLEPMILKGRDARGRGTR